MSDQATSTRCVVRGQQQGSTPVAVVFKDSLNSVFGSAFRVNITPNITTAPPVTGWRGPGGAKSGTTTTTYTLNWNANGAINSKFGLAYVDKANTANFGTVSTTQLTLINTTRDRPDLSVEYNALNTTYFIAVVRADFQSSTNAYGNWHIVLMYDTV